MRSYITVFLLFFINICLADDVSFRDSIPNDTLFVYIDTLISESQSTTYPYLGKDICGIQVLKSMDSSLLATIPIEKNKYNGPFISYNEDGFLSMIRFYEGGLLKKEIEFHKGSNLIKSMGGYENFLMPRKIFVFRDNEFVEESKEEKIDVKHGKWFFYNLNGSVDSVEFWDKGQLTSVNVANARSSGQ